ncbi:hypothetical protein [Desulfuromonas acetoxidans]|uniref:hypothetical protein n=1 Tax=Desulfuromonas acetoxidans TaxID=891 RepID=UPI00292D7A64|nr:hypothetical protein [Desulfuromonas acetoxidans]
MNKLEDITTQWITEITKEGGLPENCQAIYIGLLETETNYIAHFMGSAEFTPGDDDWACEDEDSYFPENRYLDTGISAETDWEEFQELMVKTIENLKKNKNLIFSQAKGLAVGFDSGELIYIQ